MAHSSEPGAGALGLTCLIILLLGCGTPESPPLPPGGGSLAVAGRISEAGQPPSPPLPVTIQAWGALEPGGTDSVRFETDASGHYTAQLGPFARMVVDSIRIRVTQFDCGRQTTTDVRRQNVSLSSDGFVAPDLALSYRLPEAQFGAGAEMCGAILVPSTQGVDGEYARLALWIDQVTDSVRGRWRLNYSTSIGDEYGSFAGSAADTGLVLTLDPQPGSACGTTRLTLPFAQENSATLGVGELASEGGCVLPGSAVRFFAGASPLMPALRSRRTRD